MPLNNDSDRTNNRNLIVAIVLFMATMFCYNYFTDNSSSTTDSQSSDSRSSAGMKREDSNEVAAAEQQKPEVSIQEAITNRHRVTISNENMVSSIDLDGCILDIVTLKKYKQTTDKNSDNVRLLTPKGTHSEFYYEVSYKDKTNGESIAGNHVWVPVEERDGSVAASMRTKHGIEIRRTVEVDDGYLVNITDEIKNVSGKSVAMSAVASLVKSNPTLKNYAVVHEGLVGVSLGKVDELKYSDVVGETRLSGSDWFGFTDIHWLCALINKDPNFTISHSKFGNNSLKISAMNNNDIELQPDAVITLRYSAFMGPKDIGILSDYGKRLGLQKFDMAIDFGWFFIVTKPLVYLMDIFANIFSNMGLVVLILTLMFKVLTYPLTKKSFASMAKMRELQPKIANLQKTYSHDKVRMNQELMALYKKERVSPMSGCLPMILQAPIFFCLYKVFFVSIQMRHAPLFLWIRDLSAPDSLYIFNLFGAIDWTPPGFLHIGVWPIIMGITMFLQQKLSSAGNARSAEKTSEQKMQENMMMVLPVIFTYICSSFPVGVVIYWTISNIVSVLQQRYAMACAAKPNQR